MQERQRVPRIASYLMHVQRGGYFTITERNGKKTYTVDTAPKHAKAMRGHPVQSNGVIFPIRNPPGPRVPVAKVA